jgi:peptidyl-prolyl cis-trans isomerase C
MYVKKKVRWSDISQELSIVGGEESNFVSAPIPSYATIRRFFPEQGGGPFLLPPSLPVAQPLLLTHFPRHRRFGMRRAFLSCWAVVALGLLTNSGVSQEKPAAPAPPPTPVPSQPAPAANVVAATVNGQVIPELAVFRALKRVPPEKQAEARSEILKFLIDNTLVDQYLTQLRIAVDPKDVDAKLKQVRDEIQKQGSTFDKVMQELLLDEAELRTQISSQLRWEKFAAQQATDKAVKDLFDANPQMFDGTMVRARHILLTPSAGDAKAAAEAQAKLRALKKQVEDAVAQGMAKLPAQTDNLEREKTRTRLMDDAFGELAAKESACPSRAQRGDLGYFPWASMVEPFAKVAFALKPYQMSDVVASQFGFHLILVIDHRAGKQPKFEEVKDDVKEYFHDRLREAVVARQRPLAKIDINAAAKGKG